MGLVIKGLKTNNVASFAKEAPNSKHVWVCRSCTLENKGNKLDFYLFIGFHSMQS